MKSKKRTWYEVKREIETATQEGIKKTKIILENAGSRDRRIWGLLLKDFWDLIIKGVGLLGIAISALLVWIQYQTFMENVKNQRSKEIADKAASRKADSLYHVEQLNVDRMNLQQTHQFLKRIDTDLKIAAQERDAMAILVENEKRFKIFEPSLIVIEELFSNGLSFREFKKRHQQFKESYRKIKLVCDYKTLITLNSLTDGLEIYEYRLEAQELADAIHRSSDRYFWRANALVRYSKNNEEPRTDIIADKFFHGNRSSDSDSLKVISAMYTILYVEMREQRESSFGTKIVLLKPHLQKRLNNAADFISVLRRFCESSEESLSFGTDELDDIISDGVMLNKYMRDDLQLFKKELELLKEELYQDLRKSTQLTNN